MVSAACAVLKCPGVAKNVLMQLADIANDEGFAWPSIETLCMRTDWSRTAVIDAIAWLEAHGAIRADRRNGRHTVYWVTPRAFTGERHPEPRPANLSASRARDLFAKPDGARTNQYASRTGTPPVPVRQPDPTSTPGGPDQYASRTLTPRNHQEQKTPQPPAVPARGARVGVTDGCDGRGADDGFEAVAAGYPRRGGIEAARRDWAALKPDAQLQAEIVRAIRAWQRSPEWQREEGRYIPKLGRFLREQRWIDAPGAGTPAPAAPPPVLAPVLTAEQMAANKVRARELVERVKAGRRGEATAA
jgi:hypothetical protein